MNYNDTSVETSKRLYYSSSQGPFHNANNIIMFYGGGGRGKIVESIVRAIRTDEPLIHVHGERGSGKTMLSLVISDRLKNRYNTIRYDVPRVSVSLLLRHLLIELCPQKADLISARQALAGENSESEDAAVIALCNQLCNSSGDRVRKPYVLLLDSNDQLDEKTLQIIEQLTAVRVAGHAIFHCVIFQRTDADDPNSARFSQATSWPSNHFWLQRLTLAEINEYLRHQMLLFDFNRRDLFSREMAYFIAGRSEGVFRGINKLAQDAFTIAKLQSADKVAMSHLLVAGLSQRSEASGKSRFLIRHRAGVFALLGSCVVASVAAAVFLML
ncbi:MAG: type II secretory pathway predicted ATPase ExeA [Granulosicoccus sp.]|jgi:type II secretory pathway predicted ATPase ExeA